MTAPTTLMYGGAPCEWPISYLTCDDCPELAAQDLAALEDMARQYLWNWTGRVFGLCPETVRPCFGCERTGSTYRGGQPVPWGHPVSSCGLCGRAAGCGCRSTNSVALPSPVAYVDEVLVDGAALPPEAWAVYDQRFLVRTDGGEWPRCQDLTLPDTAPGTWSVAYRRGIEVPVPGQVATGVLACELAKAACNAPSCRLPRRLQSITRQGVAASVSVADPFDGLDKGLTGIWAIDSWTTSLTAPRSGGRVRSVDTGPRARRVTDGSGTWRR